MMTGQKREKQVNFFEGDNIPSMYFHIALPLTVSLLINVLYGIVDTFFVARTGNTDLVAAVSLCAPVFTLQMAIGNLFAQGSSSLISRLLGEEKQDRVRHVSAFCFYMAILSGVVIGILLLLFQGRVLRLLGANEAAYGYALAYLRVIAVGSPFAVLTFIHSNLLRAEGLSNESMIGSVSGSIVNIALDPLLIPLWGAAGAAVATVLGHVFTDLVLLYFVMRKSRILSVRPSVFPVTRYELGQVIGIGTPAALSNVLMMISTVLTNQFLQPYGNTRIAALGISARGVTIVSLVLTGFTFGGAPLFGYFYGARHHKNSINKLRRVYHFGLKLVCGLSLSLSIVIFAIAPYFIGAFMKEPEILYHGTLMLRLHIISMVFAGLVSLYSIIFQSTGKIRASFFLSLARQGLVFIPVLVIMSALFGYIGIISAQTVTDVVSFLCAYAMFRRILAKEFADPDRLQATN